MIVFVHGWGLAPDLWSQVRAMLSDCETVAVDLGFHQAPPFCPALLPRPPIVVGHSMGFAWTFDAIPPPWKGAISVNGFGRFSRMGDFICGVDQRILARMIARMQSAPAEVTGDFLTRAGHPAPQTGDLAPARLTEALEWLGRMDRRAAIKALDCPLIALCGTQDAIVGPEMSRASFAPDQIDWVDQGSHMLPLTHAPLIARHIRALAARP